MRNSVTFHLCAEKPSDITLELPNQIAKVIEQLTGDDGHDTSTLNESATNGSIERTSYAATVWTCAALIANPESRANAMPCDKLVQIFGQADTNSSLHAYADLKSISSVQFAPSSVTVCTKQVHQQSNIRCITRL